MGWVKADMPPEMRKKVEAAEKKHKRMQKKFREQITAAEKGDPAPLRKRSKMGNIKTEVNGIMFDSMKEANRYSELLLLEKVGTIKDLRLQHEFTLQDGFKTPTGEKVRAIRYVADFTYWERKEDYETMENELIWSGATRSGWKFVVEDTKGFRTEKYKIKKKLLFDKFGINIRET